MAASSGGNSFFFNIKISPWIQNKSSNASSTDIAEGFHDDLHNFRYDVEKNLQTKFPYFRIVSIQPFLNTTHVDLFCAVEKTDDFEQFVSTIHSGNFQDELTNACKACGFQFRLEKDEKLSLSVQLGEDDISRHKSVIKAERETQQSRNIGTLSNRKDVMIVHKRFVVSIPTTSSKIVTSVRLVCPDLKEIDNRNLFLTTTNGVYQVHVHIPSEPSYFSYRYLLTIWNKSSLPVVGKYFDSTEEIHSRLFQSNDLNNMLDLISEDKHFYVGFAKMCSYLISGVTEGNVKERIMMLEHFQTNHVVCPLGKTTEVIKEVLKSSYVLFSTERCLAFVCFIGNIFNDLTKLGSENCIDSETSHKLLNKCRNGDMYQLPTSCRRMVKDVLEELCKIRSGNMYNVLTFMFMTYPFLPLESFHLKEIQKHDLKGNGENTRMLQSVTKLICKKIVDQPPAKNERDFLDQFQRHLPLELQAVIVDYLVESQMDKEYVESSVNGLLTMFKVHLKTACSKGRMNDLISHFELLRRKPYIDDEVLISEFEPSFLHCLKEFDKKLREDYMNTIFGVCVSESVFQSVAMKEKLVSVVVKSRNVHVHFLFIQCLQNRKFGDLEGERYVQLAYDWFETAVEYHCSCSPKDNTEFVKSVYQYLGDLLSVDTLSKLPDFTLSVCERAYSILHTIDILDTINSIPKIEELPDVKVEDIFKQHVQRHLKESFSAGLTDIPDLVKRICGKSLEKIRISSKPSLATWTSLIEYSGVKESYNDEEAFPIILDTKHLWIAVLNAEGKKKHEILNHPLVEYSKRVITSTKNLVQQKKITSAFFKKIRKRCEDCLEIWKALEVPMKISTSTWKSLDKLLEERLSETHQMSSVLNVIKGKIDDPEVKHALADCKITVDDFHKEIANGKVIIADVENTTFTNKTLQSIFQQSRFLLRLAKSGVFWNLMQDYVKAIEKSHEDEGAEEGSETIDDYLYDLSRLFDGDSLLEKDVVKPSLDGTRTFTIVLKVVTDIAKEGGNLYKDFWYPLLQGEDKPLVTIDEVFLGSDLEFEIKTAQEHCSCPMDPMMEISLKKFFAFDDSKRNLQILEKALDAFEINCDKDTLFQDAKSAYNKIRTHKLEELTLCSVREPLSMIEKVSSLMSGQVTEILQQVGHASLLIEFLRSVADDDLRNLIDAVEEHSEQYVRESTVSDLIGVKRFFQPLLRKDFSSDVSDFLQTVNKSVENSGVRKVSEKIYDCVRNLHGLKALYKHVANRGERTKEIVENIVNRGKFHFILHDKWCDVSVEYRQNKNISSHGLATLNDLRSRALLLMNSDDRKTTTTSRKDALERFVEIVDIALEIAAVVVQLKMSGHFRFSFYDLKCPVGDKLIQTRNGLVKEFDAWQELLRSCRNKFYLMNFIHGDQLQVLYEYMKNGGNENLVRNILKFIHPDLIDFQRMRQGSKNLDAQNPKDILLSIGQSIHTLCENLKTIERRFLMQNELKTPSEVVQPGRPYLVSLDSQSRLVVGTLLALYQNTTGSLPQAHQILFCNSSTSFEEVLLTIRRCVGDPHGGLYCIANVEKLHDDQQFKLAAKVQQLPNETYRLAIICKGGEHHPFVDQFSDFIMHPKALSPHQLQTCFRQMWPNVCTFISDVPGLGKSDLIHSLSREKGLGTATLHVSGPIQKKEIVEKLLCIGIKSFDVLHIDIGVVTDPHELDENMFELIATGFLSSGTACFCLPTSYVYIEIGNSIGHRLRDALTNITCFNRKHIEWDDYKSMKISNEICSPVQVVCSYLKSFKEKTIDEQDIYFNGPHQTVLLTQEECRSLLKLYFSTSADLSYSIVNTFLGVLSDQLKKLSTSLFFRTQNLQDLKVKSELMAALIAMSKDFSSRSILSCRSTQTAALVSDDTKNNDDILTSAEELAKRVEGMIRWEDSNHLMVLFHEDMNTVSALYRNKSDVPLQIKSLFESQLNRKLEEFSLKSQDDLNAILVKLTRSSNKQPIDFTSLTKDYALTPDNLLKMVLMYLRIKAHVPVVIMGETGCGKTSLVRYLASVCGAEFEVLSIHAGVRENVIVKRIEDCDKKARKSPQETRWLFLDEINTCDHLGLLADIICHNKCLGKNLAANIAFIGACNPYRLRSMSSIHTAGLQTKIKTDELSRLVYRVHPLPEMMVDYVFDFGSLSDGDEEKYVERMVHNVMDEKDWTSLIVNLITESQRFVRKNEQACSVSLRDVERCKKLISWFMDVLRKKIPMYGRYFGDLKIRSIILALAVCYQSRFADGQKRKEYRQAIASVFLSHTKISSQISSEKCVKDIIEKEQDDIIDRMELPEGIAKNTALRENVFVILVCILNKIPIFVVGKPGCSKSLSMQLIRSNLRGKDSKDDFFRILPQLYCVSFQGSESSTSDGIIKVFDKAKKYQEHNSEEDVMSVVILDEIGLAEISRFNPLKVLHSLLEPENKTCPDVAVVGISNWALDAAKMNRAIHLSRPEMDCEELFETSRSISLSLKEQSRADSGKLTFLINKQQPSFCRLSFGEEEILHGLADGFFQYSKEQTFKNFHGLRDFYSLTKYISKGLLEAGTEAEGQKGGEIVLRGLRRNLGGLPTEMLKVEKTFMDKMNLQSTGCTPVLDLIKDNLADKLARHLMLITSGNAVMGVLETMLHEMQKPFIVILGSQFEDDQTDEYHYRILSRIILCMEQGFCLILKDLENIYGSLYDMLNQNYTTVGQKRNCRVALGPYSNPMCHVHNSFKCIVIVEEKKLDLTDPPFLNRFEKQSFRYVDMLDEHCTSIIAKLNTFVDESCYTQKQFKPSDTYPLYTEDLVPSLVIAENMKTESDENMFANCCSKLLWISTPDAILRMPYTQAWGKNAMYFRKLQKEYFSLPIHSGLEDLLAYVVEKDKKAFKVDKGLTVDSLDAFLPKDAPPVHEIVSENNFESGSPEKSFDSSIEECIDNSLSNEEETNGVSLIAILTHSNIHTSIHQICHTFDMQNEKLSSFRSEKALYTKVRDFFESHKTLLTLQCSFVRDSHHTLMAKTMIEEQRHNYKTQTENCFKIVCLIFHLEHDDSDTVAQIDFLSGWQICMLDTLQKPVKDIPSMQIQTVHDILSERRPLHVHICENLFWAFSRIKYSGSGHSIVRMLKLIENIKSSERMLKILEEFILEWIYRKTTADKKTSWLLDIACDKRKLLNGGSFNRTVEIYLADMIKVPLAMVIYRLEEANSLECVFVDDERSAARFNSWSNLLKKKDFIHIDETNEPSGPECYTCESPLLSAKMPFSYIVIQLTEKHKDEYLDTVSRLKIACEIEDEDLPKSIFTDLLTKYKDIIHIDVAEISDYAYMDWEEDYTSDFWENVSMNHCKSVESREKIQILKWVSTFFMEFDDDELIGKIAKLHLVNWTYGSTLLNILMLFELIQSFKQMSAIEFIDMVKKLTLTKCNCDGDVEDDAPQSDGGQPVKVQNYEMYKESIVESICVILLPKESTMAELKSIKQWQTSTNSILPYLGSVSLSTNGIHCLRFCNDLATNLFALFDIQEKLFVVIGNMLASTDGILDGSEVRESVFNILYQLCEEKPEMKLQIQKVLAIYVHRCLAADENSKILHYVIECIGNDRFIDFDCSFMGPIFSYAFDIEESEDEDFLFKMLENPSGNVEINSLLQSIDTTLKILYGKDFPDPPLASLLVEVIQKKFELTVNKSNVSKFDSTSNTHVQLLKSAVDVVKSSTETTILVVTAIAFIRQIIISTVHQLKDEGYSVSSCLILMQQLDATFTPNDNADELNIHRTQCLVLFFLRCIREIEGSVCSQKRCATLFEVMPSLKDYVLSNTDLLEVPYLNPLRFLMVEYSAVEQALLAMEEKKIDQLQQFLLDAREDRNKLLCLFNLFAEKMYFRNSIEEVPDTFRDTGRKALSMVSSVNFETTHLNVMRFLALEADFLHKMFAINTESDTEVVQKLSVLIHLMCSILTYGKDGNIWYDWLSDEKAVANRKLPGLVYTEEDIIYHESPFLCKCGYRFISFDRKCPKCGSNQESGKLGETITSASSQMKSGFSNKLHFQIGYFLAVGVQICSYAIGVCMDPNCILLGTKCNADTDIHNYLQGEIIATWSHLEESLQMSCEDLSSFLRLTILRLKDVLYNGEALFCCKYASDEVNMVEREMNKVFEELIPNRFKQITLFHREFYQSIKENHRGLLTQMDESMLIDTKDGKQLLLPSLFKINAVPSFQGLLTEVRVCRNDHSFLAMVLRDLELLSLPQYILPLLRWHQVGVTIGSFKVRKVECPEITVRKFITMERVDSRRRLLKKSFEDFIEAWQKLRMCIEHIPDEWKSQFTDLPIISNNSKLETCLIINENSSLELMLRFLVHVQNDFLDKCLSLSCNGCVNLQFLLAPSDVCSSAIRSVPFKEAMQGDIIVFEWDDEMLNFSQGNTRVGEGKQVAYDLDKIERELAFSIVQGKRYLDCALDIGKITFIDELFQNSAQLLHDIQQKIPQEPLKSEIIKAVMMKKEDDYSFTEELLTQIGMALSIMKKVGADPTETLIDFLEEWKDIMSPKSYMDLLPEPRSSLRVCHVVALFQYLEELGGDSILESLEDCYRIDLPVEGKMILENFGRTNLKHLEKIGRSLKIFLHRSMTFSEKALKLDQPLSDYLMDPKLWPQGSFLNGNIAAEEKGKVVQVPLQDVVHTSILVEHIYGTISYIQEFIEIQKEQDQRISSVVASYQSANKEQKQTKKSKVAKKKFGKT